MTERIYTLYQVADLLGSTPGEVMDWIDKGWLACRRGPNQPLRIAQGALLSFLKDRGIDIEAVLAKADEGQEEKGEGRNVPQGDRDRAPSAALRSLGEAGAKEGATGTRGPDVDRDDRAASIEPTQGATVNRSAAELGGAHAMKPPAGLAGERPRLRAEDRPSVEPEKQRRTASRTVGGGDSDDPGRPGLAAGDSRYPAATAYPQPAIQAKAASLPPGLANGLGRGEPHSKGQAAAEAGVPAAPPAEFAPVPTRAVTPAAEAATAAEAPAQAAAQVAEAILRDAVARKATAVHLEAAASGLSLKLRIDGTLHDKANFRRLPPAVAPALVAHFKRLAGLDAQPGPLPQSGSFSTTIDNRGVDVRLHACPTAGGQSVVLHIRDAGFQGPSLASLGLADDDEADLQMLVGRRAGLILLAAAPGSGGRDMMRALGAEAARDGLPGDNAAEARPVRSVAAICAGIGGAGAGETAWRQTSPPWHPRPGVTAIRIDPSSGLDSARAIAAAADQDADVIVAELDDPAAAVAACQAAQRTLVVALAPARDAAGALDIVLGLDMKRWPMSAWLLALAAVAQVRKLCPNCRQGRSPTAHTLRELGIRDLDFTAHGPTGCNHCLNSGFVGRATILDLVRIDGPTAAAIRNGLAAPQILDAARRGGARTLLEAGLALARARETSLEELARVL